VESQALITGKQVNSLLQRLNALAARNKQLPASEPRDEFLQALQEIVEEMKRQGVSQVIIHVSQAYLPHSKLCCGICTKSE
jgi:hypothetical protein